MGGGHPNVDESVSDGTGMFDRAAGAVAPWMVPASASFLAVLLIMSSPALADSPATQPDPQTTPEEEMPESAPAEGEEEPAGLFDLSLEELMEVEMVGPAALTRLTRKETPASVTVITDEGTLADAAATALIVAGLDEWREVARSLGLEQVMMIDESGKVYQTAEMAGRIELQEGVEFEIVDFQANPGP